MSLRTPRTRAMEIGVDKAGLRGDPVCPECGHPHGAQYGGGHFADKVAPMREQVVNRPAPQPTKPFKLGR